MKTRSLTAQALCLALITGCGNLEEGSELAPFPETDTLTAVTAPATTGASLGATPQQRFAARIGGDGQGSQSLPPPALAVREGISAQELAALEETKRRIPATPAAPAAPAARSADEHALDVARRSAPDALLRIVVVPTDSPFDFSRFQGADDARRAGLIAERSAQVAQTQERLTAELSRLGARDVSRLPLINQLHTQVPARHVEAISRLPGVEHVYLDETKGGPTGYGGLESRQGTLVNTFLGAGYNGNMHSRNGSAYATRLGIIEWDCASPKTNWPNRNHVGYEDVAGGSSRIRKVYNCTSGSCTQDLTSNGGNTHGNFVSWTAAGSIEQGQSPSFPGSGTVDQQRRSGSSPESEIYYYAICGCGAVSTALDQAIADGVDVTNMSFRMGDCDGLSFNCGGMNEALERATDAGIVNVAASGNYGSYGATSCNLIYPSWRPDVLGVNGLDTSNLNQDYNTAILADDTTGPFRASGRGPVPIRTFKGLSTTMSGIGLTAPAIYSYYFGGGTDSYGGGNIAGTSFAAPTVAGAVANMRHAFNALNWPLGNDARMLMTVMFLMGDGWNGQSPGADTRTHTSSYSGFGRLHGHFPASASMTGPWGWGLRGFVIHDKQTVSWTVMDPGPESSLFTQWKWVLTWFENDLNNVADIDISVWDTCPAGGGAPVMVASQADYDLRNRITLGASELRGRCLEMRAYGYNVPPEGRLVYTTDYVHSGDPAQH
jgi:hypothetical protein